jgi:hypothetical protein
MVSPYFRLTLRDLEMLSSLSDNPIKLGSKQEMVLFHFAQNPATSAYDISPIAGKDKKSKKEDYKYTGKIIKRLAGLRLIKEVTKEVTKKKPNPHDAHYYRLSEHGVHYIITNNINLKYDILKGLLKNYGDHPLFRYILYPSIKRDTLLKIGDSAIFDQAFSYLYDCYQRVEDTIPSIIHKGQIDNQTQNGYVTRRLFSWDLSNDDKDILRSFLKQKYKWNWVDNAKVSKTRDGNTIKISDGLNSVLIKLNSVLKTKAALVFNRKKVPEVIYEFVVQGSDVYTSQPYRSYLRTLDPSRLPPPISPEEDYMESFLYFLLIRAQQLIFSILSNYVEPGYSAAMRILRHDPKFMQVLKETKNEFEKKYAFFIGKQ